MDASGTSGVQGFAIYQDDDGDDDDMAEPCSSPLSSKPSASFAPSFTIFQDGEGADDADGGEERDVGGHARGSNPLGSGGTEPFSIFEDNSSETAEDSPGVGSKVCLVLA